MPFFIRLGRRSIGKFGLQWWKIAGGPFQKKGAEETPTATDGTGKLTGRN
jgi:hypothetical protein